MPKVIVLRGFGLTEKDKDGKPLGKFNYHGGQVYDEVPSAHLARVKEGKDFELIPDTHVIRAKKSGEGYDIVPEAAAHGKTLTGAKFK